MSLKKVLILLSTYNGHFYLEEQLKSLINQNNVDVHFLIRDDGSTDDTLGILYKFQSRTNNVTILKGKNVGCERSYLNLLSYANTRSYQYDYFAFCDQDDVWLEDKLIRAVSILEKFNNSIPSLYCSHAQLVDEKLRLLKSIPRKLKCTFGESMVSNGAIGCTVVFNKVLMELVNLFRPAYISMHDSWLYRLCLATNGNVFYDSKSYILYRQHSKNAIGGNIGIGKRWRRRFGMISSRNFNTRQNVAENLLLGFGAIVSEENKGLLVQIINYKKNLKSRLNLLLNKSFRTNSLEHNLMFKIAVLFGIY